MKLYGDATSSPKYLQKSELLPAGQRLEWEPIELPEDILWGMEIPAAVRKYISSRGISQYMANKFALVYWPATDRIVIPYFNDKGEPIFLAAHSHKGALPKYLYPKGPKPLYIPGRPGVNFCDHVVIVEGQWDSMITMLADYKAIAIGGSYLAPHVEQDLLEEIGERKVSVCLDGDALVPASKLVQRLLELGIYSKIIILKLGDDPASVGVERLKELIG